MLSPAGRRHKCILQMICSLGTKMQLSRATATEQSAKQVYRLLTQNYSPAVAVGFVKICQKHGWGGPPLLQPLHSDVVRSCPLGRRAPGLLPGSHGRRPCLWGTAARQSLLHTAFPSSQDASGFVADFLCLHATGIPASALAAVARPQNPWV